MKYLFKDGNGGLKECECSDSLAFDNCSDSLVFDNCSDSLVFDDGKNGNNPFAATIHFDNGKKITTNESLTLGFYVEK